MNNQYIHGIGFLLLGELMLAVMAATIKAIDPNVPHTMVVFFRNFFGLIFLTPLILLQLNSFKEIKTKKLSLHLIRVITGLSAMYGFIYIIRHIPLAEATLVKMSVPFFLPIVADYWLKDKISKRTSLSIIIGFIGVIFVLKPGSNEFNPIALWGLIAAVLASVAKVAIRKMGSTEPAIRIVLYFSVMSTVLSLIPALINWQSVTSKTWKLFMISGLLGTLGQITITQAYRIAPPGKIGLYTYSTLVYSSLIGWWFWAEHLSFYTLAGFGFIFIAGFLNYKG